MTDEPVPLVVFVLVAYAAFAVPTAIAFVLFGLIRREGKIQGESTKQEKPHKPFPRHRYARWDRE